MTTQSRKLVISAYATGDGCDGPSFAVVEDVHALISQMTRLQTIVSDNSLSEVRVSESPEFWGPGSIEDELRLTCGELVVGLNCAWFIDTPKHADYRIETELFDLNQLKKLLDEAQGDGPVFIGHQSLIEAYNDDLIERAEEDEDSTESDSVNS
jgi:hypothetical protein